MLKRLVGRKIDEFSFLKEHRGCKKSTVIYHFYIVCTSCLNEQVDIWGTQFLLFYSSVREQILVEFPSSPRFNSVMDVSKDVRLRNPNPNSGYFLHV